MTITAKIQITLTISLLLLLPCSTMALTKGQPLVPFYAKTMNGKGLDMSTIIGQKPVMLVFWASWCPNCKVEMPQINRMYQEFSEKGMEFIGINVGFNDSIGRATKFIRKNDMEFPNIFDAANSITKQYMVHGVPTVIVADKKGTIAYRNFAAPDLSPEDVRKLLAD